MRGNQFFFLFASRINSMSDKHRQEFSKYERQTEDTRTIFIHRSKGVQVQHYRETTNQ